MTFKAPEVLSQIIRFGLTGFIKTVVGLGIIFAAMAFGAHYIVANILGYGVGMIMGYRLGKNWVFVRSSPENRVVLFVLCLAFAYACNLATLFLSVEIFKISEFVAQVLATIVFTLVSFLGQKIVVFPISQ